MLLRREGSNLRPSGYEPDELPLLYFAIWLQMYNYSNRFQKIRYTTDTCYLKKNIISRMKS